MPDELIIWEKILFLRGKCFPYYLYMQDSPYLISPYQFEIIAEKCLREVKDKGKHTS